MRLSRLSLTRYGRFTDLALDFGSKQAGRPDLHIVYGPNEAGKSTAFSGFLDLIFGIEPRSRYGFLHPYAAMQVGARLEWGGETHDVVRVKRNQNSFLSPGGQPLPEAMLGGALGGIDRDAYRTMFSLDDESLEKGGESILESRGDLGRLLFSASAGLAELSRTLEALQAEAEAFYKFRAHRGELVDLKAQLTELRTEREAVDTQASAFAQLVAERLAARQAYDEAAAALGAIRARIEEIGRLLAAHPAWLRLSAGHAALAALEGLPEPPEFWGDELPLLQREAVELETRRENAAAAIDRLDREIAALPLDGLALGFGNRLKQLGELAGRFVKAQADLPAERQKLAESERAIAGIRQKLGREEGEAEALLLPAALTARLRTLAGESSLVAAKLEAARGEAKAAAEWAVEAQARLAALGGSVREGGSMEALKAALAAWRADDAPARQRLALRNGEAQEAVLAERLLQLSPWTGAPEALAAMPLPALTRLEGWRTALGEREAAAAQTGAEAERLKAECARLAAGLEADSSAGLSGTADPAAVRGRREALWAAHRRALDGASAEAFEQAMRADDEAAAARLAQVQAAARQGEARRALAVAKAGFSLAEERRRLAADELAGLRAEIRRDLLAAAPGLPEGWPIEEWLAWSAKRDRALETWSALRACGREARTAAADAAEGFALLRDALAKAGADPGSAPDEALPALADRLLGREAEISSARSESQARTREAETRAARLREAEATERAWRGAWAAACGSSWLGEGAAPDAVRAALDALAMLEPALERRDGFTLRIAMMEEDAALFAREVQSVALLLGAGREGADPMPAYETAAARIRAAELAQERRAAKAAERQAAAAEAERLAGRAVLHERRAAEMTGFFGAGSLAEVGAGLDNVRRRRELQAEAQAAAREVAQALGQADAAPDEARLAALDPAALRTELAALAARVEAEEARARELYAAWLRAHDRVEAVGGDDAAARIEERRRTVLLDIEERALNYLRLRVGIAATEAALRAYRENHRSSMMERASDAFRTVSRGAYAGLGTQPGRDGDVLVGISADGASKLASEMSKGTRFQLYLALRVAGYFEFARARAPVPFIADDIMETFDDFRAEEAFRLFAGMADVGQVIYLTHHRHLCDLARAVCPTVTVHDLPAGG